MVLPPLSKNEPAKIKRRVGERDKTVTPTRSLLHKRHNIRKKDYKNPSDEKPLQASEDLKKGEEFCILANAAIGRVYPAFVGDVGYHLHPPCCVSRHVMGFAVILLKLL